MPASTTEIPRLTREQTPAKIGLVHMGPGAFFRAFTAIYTHEAMLNAGGDWGVCAVSLKSRTAHDQLVPQQGAYTSTSLDATGRESRIIESIVEVLVASEDPQAVLRRLADPAVNIVSLTITEKGYCHHPSSGQLDLEHLDIIHDMEHPHTPRSAPGLIVEGLALRRKQGVAPYTIVSCDNLPSNGKLVRAVVLDLAAARDDTLADWVSSEARFPSTMVDRITPATTNADIEELSQREGYLDPGCVLHEPFRQWVIEDAFVGARPAWERAGAQLVASVEAHEVMKLRCLNGTHSALAYLGYLAGFETIADTVDDPVFKRFVHALWQDEITPTVPCPKGENLERYCRSLFSRYCNPVIQHRTWQIAMDGSSKLPQRLLGTIRDNLARGIVPEGLCLAVAAWMTYVGGRDEHGEPIDVRDPMAAKLAEICQQNTGSADTVSALLAIDTIFDPELTADKRFSAALVAAHENLAREGARAAIARLKSHG